MVHTDSRLMRALRFLHSVPHVPPDGSRVRLRTLVLIRWVAVAGQTTALLIVYIRLGYDLPIVPAILLIAASIGVNLHASFTRPGGAWLGDRAASLYLAYDLVQLSLLLWLTGGLTNPFAIFLLAPVTVSASMLSRQSTVILAVLAVAAVTIVALWHQPLPWRDDTLHLPQLYILGIWVALVMAVVFIAGYVYSLAAEAQRMSDALSATQIALAREQRLSALGGLAAAAAHELGSPLSTIAVVARELAKELPEDSAYKEDAELLLQESARCRDILARLARQPEEDGEKLFHRVPLTALAAIAASPYRRDELAMNTYRAPRDDSAQPEVTRTPEILHGIGTLVQNAVRFAASRVDLEVGWNTDSAWICIRDDGPGFAEDILPFLGEPYISSKSRDDGGEHMGLGIFIARTLLARTGADVDFSNRPEGGASVTVRWPRTRLERRETASIAQSEGTHRE